MAIRPSGREEMVAANIARARSNRIIPKPAAKAQDAAKSNEQGGGSKASPNKEDNGPEVYRYPYKALHDTTDALLISIYEPMRTSDVFGLKDVFTAGNFDINKIGIPNFSEAFEKESRGREDKKRKTKLQYIYLPIPQSVSDTLNVSYSEDTLNPLQAAGLGAVSGIIDKPAEAATNSMEAVRKIFSGEIKGLSQEAKNAVIAGFSGIAINNLGANVSPQSLITRATGQILQSNLELLFSGVTLRSFPFVFDFAPRDEEEGYQVKAIIRALKQGMVPKKGNALFISSPKVFQLEYITGQKAHPFLNKFKVCALTSMAVNYTASGTYATYADGTPVHMQVTCTFQEINPIYSEDYDEKSSGDYAPGNDPANFGVGY